MATKEEVRQRVGEDLSLVPLGQDLESQDQARIDRTFNETYKMLKTRGLATWASDADVPDEVVPYFCLLMEEKLLTSYSVPESRFMRIKQDAGPDGATALMNLAKVVTPIYESTTSSEDF